MAQSKATFGYWNIRGLGHQIRYLLEYLQVEYDEKTYHPTSEGAPEWFGKDKLELDLELPNLPYYLDGDCKITESIAILQYLGRKHNLLGSTEQEKIRNDQGYGFQVDARRNLLKLFFNPNFEKEKDGVIKALPDRLAKLEKFLGDRKFFTGDNLATCDFTLYDILDVHRIFVPGILDQFPKLSAFMKRFEEVPTIKAYMESERYYTYPVTAGGAYWGQN